MSAILERLGAKVKVGGDAAALEVELKKLGVSDPEHVVRRWATGKDPIWIIVDDVDQNFENTPVYRARVASFFVACRQVVNAIPELRIRAAVRPNVWTTLKMLHEPLSHIEQYMTEVSWDENMMRRLLARRVQGYLVRRNLWADVAERLPTDNIQRDRELLGMVFEDPMEWGKGTRPPHVVLHTLSKHRPRWLIELCSLAAREAGRSSHFKIMRGDVFAQLDGFGKRRKEDTIAEFRSQCPEVDELFSALHGVAEEFSTDELVRTIETRIMTHVTPHITGVPGQVKPLDVAAFLFEIGVIFARRNHPDGTYAHISYADRPSLLRSRTNVDEGCHHRSDWAPDPT